MGDKYEDLGPTNFVVPPPPPPVEYTTQPSAQSTGDRTELKSAQVGVAGAKDKGKPRSPKKALVSLGVDLDEEETKYTNAQKMGMVISGIMATLFLLVAIAAIVILATGLKIFS
ncbi:hypothetical protein X798_01700 [Onchocerca flexuosa]|uniref:Uncharacterized protein n=2 Tax=Onchocerca flexuosa TaxID=387005 RepID=A0A183H565_9BILA|nr:hypothetical protein X798_01700 [Onchocerca flexuosa]VDO33639.1 unnamed protein product [Onchocerca flexuosa]